MAGIEIRPTFPLVEPEIVEPMTKERAHAMLIREVESTTGKTLSDKCRKCEHLVACVIDMVMAR